MGKSSLISSSSPTCSVLLRAGMQLWPCVMSGVNWRVVGLVEGTDKGVWLGTGPDLGKTLISTMEMEQETPFCLFLMCLLSFSLTIRFSFASSRFLATYFCSLLDNFRKCPCSPLESEPWGIPHRCSYWQSRLTTQARPGQKVSLTTHFHDQKYIYFPRYEPYLQDHMKNTH